MEQCVVRKTLPFLEHAVLENLYSSRYTPVTFQGRPVSVGYTFNVRTGSAKVVDSYRRTRSRPAPAGAAAGGFACCAALALALLTLSRIFDF